MRRPKAAAFSGHLIKDLKNALAIMKSLFGFKEVQTAVAILTGSSQCYLCRQTAPNMNRLCAFVPLALLVCRTVIVHRFVCVCAPVCESSKRRDR